MSDTERALYWRLTDEQQHAVDLEGWCAVWDVLTDDDRKALEDDFWDSPEARAYWDRDE